MIVYAPTIARVEETVEFLEEKGIAAIAYHGQMESTIRRRNQERWMSDEVRVLVGTVAFGLGINKAAVRAVVHLSLPKSIEQYYQESGRAGRDGHPADCLLLWQKRDVGLLVHFIQQISDPVEKQGAWRRYDEIRQFAEAKTCRHRRICVHFGETPKWNSCGACDVCGVGLEWLVDANETPSKRTRKTHGAKAGTTDRAVTHSSEKGTSASVSGGAGSSLREHLREWRRNVSKAQGVPAFVVMHDTSLEELCRVRPSSIQELLQVSGFGERKAQLYGQAILEALSQFRPPAQESAQQAGPPKPTDRDAPGKRTAAASHSL